MGIDELDCSGWFVPKKGKGFVYVCVGIGGEGTAGRGRPIGFVGLKLIQFGALSKKKNTFFFFFFLVRMYRKAFAS